MDIQDDKKVFKFDPVPEQLPLAPRTSSVGGAQGVAGSIACDSTPQTPSISPVGCMYIIFLLEIDLMRDSTADSGTHAKWSDRSS